MEKSVIGIGEILWDMLPEGKKLGGAPANFAYHTAQLGLPAYIVSAVGNDHLGDEIIQHIEQKQLNHLIPHVPYPTGTVEVNIDEGGIPCYDIKQNVAWDNIPFTPSLENIAQHTRCACFGSLAQRAATSRTTINRFLDAMPDDENTYKVFDINLRQNFYSREILHISLQKCNILKINDEELILINELFKLAGSTSETLCLDLLKAYQLKMLILTCGAHGSHVFTPKEHSFVETPHVNVVDTVGAGDSFTASFMAALLHGKSTTEAHHLAVSVSAYVCTQPGAMPRLPQEFTAEFA